MTKNAARYGRNPVLTDCHFGQPHDEEGSGRGDSMNVLTDCHFGQPHDPMTTGVIVVPAAVLTDCHFGQPHDTHHYKHKKINKLQGVFGANLVTLLPAWSIEGVNAILLFKNIFLRYLVKVNN